MKKAESLLNELTYQKYCSSIIISHLWSYSALPIVLQPKKSRVSLPAPDPHLPQKQVLSFTILVNK